MNWSSVLMAFRAHIEAAVTPAPVTLGGDASIPDAAKVIILRGTTTHGDPRRGQETTLQTFVECWENSSDPDFAVGYQLLDALESKVAAAVLTFGQAGATVEGYRVRAEIGAVEGDGDVFRPSVGSRAPVTIKLKLA